MSLDEGVATVLRLQDCAQVVTESDDTESMKTLLELLGIKETIVPQKQMNSTRLNECKRMTKEELLKVIAMYHLEYDIDPESKRVVINSDRWASLSKSELVELAAQCR